MIKYLVTNRSAFLMNPETNVKVTVPSSDPAYPLIKHLILTNRPDDLKFFTDIGHRLNLSNITIESTRTRCFNIHTHNASYSTFPSMYEEVITKISSYEIDKIITIDSIINQLKNTLFNFKHISWLGDKIRIMTNGVYVKGTFNEYYINFETNSVQRGKDFVCIHVNSDYKPLELNEKETCILTKILVCLNDAAFFPNDPILKRFVTGATI